MSSQRASSWALHDASLKAEDELPLLEVREVFLSIATLEEMEKQAVVEINNTSLTDPNGPNDLRMGVVDNSNKCATCGFNEFGCHGHYGIIRLNRPIPHPLAVRQIIAVLRSVCNTCGKLLLDEDYIRTSGLLRFQGSQRLNLIEEAAVKVGFCTHSNDVPGAVIQSCRDNPKYITTNLKGTNLIQYVVKRDPEQKLSEKNTRKIVLPITTVDLPERLDGLAHPPGVLEILDSISDHDAQLLGFSNGSHPRNMVLKALWVIPPYIRAPIRTDEDVKPHPMTKLYIDIVSSNHILGEELRKIQSRDPQASMIALMEAEKNIFTCYLDLINSKENVATMGTQAGSIQPMIQGKKAIIRSGLMSKRANFSGRTVIDPDPSLKFGEIRIPEAMAPELTVPIQVANYNHDSLLTLLRAGRVAYVEHGSGPLRGQRIKITEQNKDTKDLKIGDIVHRWLQNDDVVLANRQPTLHKQGFVAFRARLSLLLSIGLNLSYTTPFNADFDGDEMSLHVPQLLDARAEMTDIVSVEQCLPNAQRNMLAYGLVMDALTGIYLMTCFDYFVSEATWGDCLVTLTNKDALPTLRERLVKHNYPMPSRQFLLGTLGETVSEDEVYYEASLRTDYEQIKNLPVDEIFEHIKEKPYAAKALVCALFPENFFYRRKVGDVLIHIQDGIILSGYFSKRSVGVSHNTIAQYLFKDYSVYRAADFLTDGQFMTNRWLMDYGMSIGLSDCALPPLLERDPVTGDEIPDQTPLIDQHIKEKSDIILLQYRALGPRPCDPIDAEQWEKKVRAIVASLESVGQVLISEDLDRENRFRIMAESGAKGSKLNVVHIRGSLGQQFQEGQRAPTLLTGNRAIHYFPPVPEGEQESLESRGYCRSSFIKGLQPEEEFFHEASSRIAQATSSTTTAITGSIYHRTVKAVEDLKVVADGSVRNSAGFVIQNVYGEDGFDAGQLLFVNGPDGRVPSFIDVANSCEKWNALLDF